MIGRSRAPRGARGLKYRKGYQYTDSQGSCPSRGTWIEIVVGANASDYELSCPSRGTWIEIPGLFDQEYIYLGRAPRGARGLKFLHLGRL